VSTGGRANTPPPTGDASGRGDIDRYRRETRNLRAPELIDWALSTFSAGGLTFASSLGAEDQVITDMIARHAPAIPLFTLDTGRLYQESYDLLAKTRDRYGPDISVFFPDAGQVERMVSEHGPNLFYDSVENRKLCCHVRKVEPLRRALAGKKAWIVGLRREQAVTRQALEPIQWDDANGLVKIAPLAAWSESEVWEYIREHDVPYHPLHDRGFRSIGCAPCTRAVRDGEDARAGRWWWEHPEHKECGLHSGNRGDTATGPGRPVPFGIRHIDSN